MVPLAHLCALVGETTHQNERVRLLTGIHLLDTHVVLDIIGPWTTSSPIKFLFFFVERAALS